MRINPSTRSSMNTLISRTRTVNTSHSPVSDVNEIKKIKPTADYSSSYSQVLSKETFYDKLEKKEASNKKNYTRQDAQNGNLPKKAIMSKEDRETIIFLNKLFTKFNYTMDKIKKIDMARNQNNFQKIKREITLNSKFLSDIGIYTDKLSHFYLNEEVFVNEITKDPIKINQLLDPARGVIKKLCDSFGGMLQ